MYNIIAQLGGWPGAVGLLALAVLCGWLASPDVKARLRGWIGEQIVRVWLRRLDRVLYHCLHDLLIPDGKGGWAQIDHVVVGPGGVFVIETKHWRGWIHGTATQEKWTLSYHKNATKSVQNPLRQNAGHIAALERLPGFPQGVCHNLVCMTGSAELKKGPIEGLVQSGLADYIRNFSTMELHPDDTAEIASLIRESDAGQDKEAGKLHRQQARAAAGKID